MQHQQQPDQRGMFLSAVAAWSLVGGLCVAVSQSHPEPAAAVVPGGQ